MNLNLSSRPVICIRHIQPSDLGILEKIHSDLFPIRYESEFFQNVVKRAGIVSWAAVDRNRPNDQSDEMIGFITARFVPAQESEISDLLSCDSSKSDQTFVYILTLGVVEAYRNHGIASSLIRKVIEYASGMPTCRAAYLHVISDNAAAIHLYNKMSFKCVRRLQGFYFINGRHYDSYLFVYYMNGGRSPCSPLELVTAVLRYMKIAFKSMSARLWIKEDRRFSKCPKGRETLSLISMTQSRRSANTECTGSEFV